MTKAVLLMRHAKSSWKDEQLADHDRPLSKRGQRDAPRMGRWLRGQRLLPELIVSSTARRAHATAALVAQEAHYEGDVRLTRDLYDAGSDDILEVIRRIEDTLATVMVIGHNPGMIDLLDQWTASNRAFPTAALAHVQLHADHWHEVDLNTPAKLVGFWVPRELP